MVAFKGSTTEGSSAEVNLIGKGTYLEGKIKTESSLRIDGRVKGSIKCENMLRIGENGSVEGDVECTNANVGGKIDGQITAKGKLVLEAKSRLVGDLKASKLVIEEGAVFDGTADMGAGKTMSSNLPKQGSAAADIPKKENE
ncbi:MAG: polymer-forming cytoskeletal protein [Caldithrix sp.]|nr:polymer-forming cytoskeletal protein [Caldithrix sp.]